ncbi:fungal-specific transcription factor domain-domain-containing protein [Kockovaella imperatae]|uniref:Fungal-specific transcription factor domain-domain-containing protein n=1 Tax=Kockovaella imperatae TaxID=4999 RepID=A0A1Y1UCV5_9TREE|nr:fungal-specific transcription factor domain-domain-containing protein [Kockovaella imperatae]ORX35880.1 fungal-specific transcription factor domain-domain-containing protein [Kockovaella imperatae]
MSRSDEDELEEAASPGQIISNKPRERKPHATRRRIVQSCSECRRRKIKCDKKFPCGPCILRSDQDRCHEVGMAEKNVVSNSSNVASTSDLALLAHRLDALEASLIKSGALLPSDMDHFLKSSRLNESRDLSRPTSPRLTPRQSIPGPSVDMDEIEDTEGAARVLEHLAFGRSRVDGGTAVPHFGARVVSGISGGFTRMRDYKGQGRDGSPTKSSDGVSAMQRRLVGLGPALSEEERSRRTDELLDLLGPTDVVNIFFRQTDVVLKLLVRILPDQEIGEVLVRTYLEKVDWLHRCIHVPTFMKLCREIWNLDRQQVVHEIPLSSVALYMTVCLLGLIFMDSSESVKYFTTEEACYLPDLWYNSVRSALWGADFIACHSTESIQSVILLMVYMKNRDRSDAAWAMLGAIIKMAQGLGLSRLGSEPEVVDGKPTAQWVGRWKSLIEREVGRRIWWNLVWLDWSLAPSYNYACCIHPEQIKTAMPGNIEDDDLVDGQPFRPQPVNVYTRMSFQLARLKFAEIGHRQIWAANNSPIESPYPFILSVDGELRRAMMDLPPFYQPDSGRGPASTNPGDQVQFYERIMLNLAVHSRVLRLHRPWLWRGYTDQRFAYSKEQCIRAARASLRMMGKHNESASFLEKWWLPLFYVSVSALVIIIDLLRTPKRNLHSNETEQEIHEVRGALEQMRRIADVSHPSQAAVKVLDLLMNEIEDRRKPALGKRKLSTASEQDEEDQTLQRAVKRLLHQAQFDSASPAQSGSSSTSKSPQPKTGREIDMRIFSDTPRDRPVFDAYPLPQAESHAPQHAPSLSLGGLLPPPSARQSGMTSPFQLPMDPDVPLNMDNSSAGYMQPLANVSAEDAFASYFAAPGGNGSVQGAPTEAYQAPEDFLSKVFNFGWEPAAVSGNAVNAPVHPGMSQQQVQVNGSLPFETWNSHGWMA